MVELLTSLIEQAKTDKKKLMALKDMAVSCKAFELAAKIKVIEEEYFQQTPDEKKQIESAVKVNTVLRMVEIKAGLPTSWIIARAMQMYFEKRGEFSLSDAADILTDKAKLFD